MNAELAAKESAVVEREMALARLELQLQQREESLRQVIEDSEKPQLFRKKPNDEYDLFEEDEEEEKLAEEASQYTPEESALLDLTMRDMRSAILRERRVHAAVLKQLKQQSDDERRDRDEEIRAHAVCYTLALFLFLLLPISMYR